MLTAIRWLRADLWDVVQVVPGHRGKHARHAPAVLDESLARWGHRLGRRRAIALARRHFLVAVAIVLAIEIVAILLGGNHRPLWLIAPLLLGLGGGALALARGVPTRQTAAMLDRGLGLHDRLGTALELEAATPAPTGLAAIVVGEANVAVGESIDTAHAVARRAGAEWASLLAGVAALAVIVTVSGIGHSASQTSAGALGKAGARYGLGTAAGRRAALHHTARPNASGAPARVPIEPPGVSFDAGAINSAHRRTAPQADYGLYGNGGHMTAAQLAQMAAEGITTQAGARVAGIGESTNSAAGKGQSGSGGASASGASGGAAGIHGAASTGGALPAPGTSAGLQTAAGAQAGGHGGSTPGHGGASAAGTGGYNRGVGRAQAGGESAGQAPGALNLGLGLVPDLTPGGSQLPLQAEFAPSASGHASAHEGISQTPNGGGGSGRTSETNGGVGGAGGRARASVCFRRPSTQRQRRWRTCSRGISA